MDYQVLARKWRPKIFSDVVGQKYVLQVIINSLFSKKLHHSYLFSGMQGIGKTTIARLFAKGLNCEIGITNFPCCKCKNCLEVERNNSIDLIEIDAASRTKVEDIRELLDNVQYLPSRGRFKIYLIDEIHMLSRHSFNALLKTLEEPPVHTKFLLATTHPKKIPITIISRCIHFHLKKLETRQIYEKLQQIMQIENINFDKIALWLLAESSIGSMRDALTLSDQMIAIGNSNSINLEDVKFMLGKWNIEQSLSIIEELSNGNGKNILTIIAQYSEHSSNWDGLITEMLSLLHFIIIKKFHFHGINDYIVPNEEAFVLRIQNLANKISLANLQLYYQILISGRKNLPYSPDPRIGVEMMLLHIISL